MKINFQNLNFSARLSRNPDMFGYEKTKQETMESYDKKIRELKLLKKQAKEFDEFMRSDEIKLLLQKLPEQDEVILRNEYTLRDKGWDDIQAEPFELLYIQDEEKYEFIKPSGKYASEKHFRFVQNNDGTINKDGIMIWLNNLVHLFAQK